MDWLPTVKEWGGALAGGAAILLSLLDQARRLRGRWLKDGHQPTSKRQKNAVSQRPCQMATSIAAPAASVTSREQMLPADLPASRQGASWSRGWSLFMGLVDLAYFVAAVGFLAWLLWLPDQAPVSRREMASIAVCVVFAGLGGRSGRRD